MEHREVGVEVVVVVVKGMSLGEEKEGTFYRSDLRDEKNIH